MSYLIFFLESLFFKKDRLLKQRIMALFYFENIVDILFNTYRSKAKNFPHRRMKDFIF